MKKTVCTACLMLLMMVTTAAAAPVRVAVIDTGVRVKQELLDGTKILPGRNYVLNNDDTGDYVGHGTRITGLILGTMDGTIYSPCRESSVIPLVYYTELASGVVQNGGVDAICRGIYDAVDHYDCRIINLSSGIEGDCGQLRQAVEYAEDSGVLLVASAGNDGGGLSYPAFYSSVVAVGSHDEHGEPSVFSAGGYGLTLLAPGENLATLSIRNAAGFETVSGTSYAAAYVTAQAAALWEQYPELTAGQVRFLLEKSCRDVGQSGWDINSGYGIIKPELLRSNAELLHAEKLLCYHDVSEHDWFFESVKAVTSSGIMGEAAEYHFFPDTPVTRSMLAAMVYRLEGKPVSSGHSPFVDVAEDEWYSDAVVWAGENGLMTGFGDRFAPDEKVSREQMATVLYRYGRYLGLETGTDADLSCFSDSESVSTWAEEAVRWAVGSELLEGTGNGCLSPSECVDRAQAAAVAARWTERYQ